MTVIVNDAGFTVTECVGEFLDLGADAQPTSEMLAAPMIRIDFPNCADGRGFTIARRLRLMGFTGRLRARGHVIADQYAMARRSGFDEVEIDDTLAKRQPEDQWMARAKWRKHDYQSRLRKGDALSHFEETR